MLLNGRATRTIWPEPAGAAVGVIDQRLLPHRVAVVRIASAGEAAAAIANMTVRGAPLIGVTAAYGLALQVRADASAPALEAAAAILKATRPTAVNLEERSAREVTHIVGRGPGGEAVEVQLVPDGTRAANPAFDVTPARLVTALVTERGVVLATPEGIAALTEGSDA